MKAFLLAAGRGTRISRMIEEVPKCTLPIGGVPLVRYTAAMLLEAGFELVVCVGYKKEKIFEALEGLPVTYYFNPFYEITNSIASLWFARSEIKSDMIVMNADVYITRNILSALMENKHEAVMMIDRTRVMDGDYFFATTFSIWGWASWKRVVDQWDEFYSFLDDSFNMQQLKQLIKERKYRSDFIYMCQRHREQQKAFYETIFHASILFNSGLSIVPTRNMINNLGATADSTHFAGSVHTLPKGYRRIFTMKRYEVDFPLRHPRYVIENVAYKEKVYRIMGWDHPWIKIGRSFEELFLNLKYGNFSIIMKAVKNRINKWLKRNKHH